MKAKTALYIFDGEPATTRPAMPLSITTLNVLGVEWHVFGEKSIIASSCRSATRCNRYDGTSCRSGRCSVYKTAEPIAYFTLVVFFLVPCII